MRTRRHHERRRRRTCLRFMRKMPRFRCDTCCRRHAVAMPPTPLSLHYMACREHDRAPAPLMLIFATKICSLLRYYAYAIR